MDRSLKISNKISLRDLWHMFLVFAVPFIGVTGVSLIPYMLRLPMMYLTFALSIIVFMFSGARITLSAPKIIFFLLLFMIGISVLYSIDKNQTVQFALIYLCCFPMLFIDMPEKYTDAILKICYIIAAVIALSILISVPVKDCMDRYFWFIVNPKRSPEVSEAISRELMFGSHSGFAREKGDAAFILNIGIAVSFSKYFSQGKLKLPDLAVLCAMMLALLLTGKRTYFVVSLIGFVLLMFFSKMKGKVFKLVAIVIIASVTVFLVMLFIPDTAVTINKFMDAENMEKLGGRSSLWKHLYAMIEQYWVFGSGFGTYNRFAFLNGLRTYGRMWTYNAHNCYLQILGELGVIGLALLILFMITSLFISVKALKTAHRDGYGHRNQLYFSLYTQVMMIVYAMTGNPIYTKQMLFMWLFSIGISLRVYEKQRAGTLERANMGQGEAYV